MNTLTTGADSIALKPIEAAHAVGRPSAVPATFAEQEFDALAAEQGRSWTAEGEAASRRAKIRAAVHLPRSDADVYAVEEHEEELREARQQFQHAARTLTPYVRRSPQDHVRYVAGWLILGGGDTAGVLGAAILLGEVPVVALGQALATGFAAVTAGMAGASVREGRQAKARSRPIEELSSDERRYLGLFDGTESRSGTAVVSLTALLIIVLVAVGVFGLRSGTEGILAGVTFAGLAAATAFASFISSYMHADAVADLIGTYRLRYRRAERHHAKLARRRALSEHSRAVAEVGSIEREHAARGAAAQETLTALKYRMLRGNPQVVGHGEMAMEPGAIGRRPRTESAA